MVEGSDREFELVRDLERLSFHILTSNQSTHSRETVQVRGFVAMDLNLEGMSDVQNVYRFLPYLDSTT